jgi:hypothetical protein
MFGGAENDACRGCLKQEADSDVGCHQTIMAKRDLGDGPFSTFVVH